MKLNQRPKNKFKERSNSSPLLAYLPPYPDQAQTQPQLAIVFSILHVLPVTSTAREVELWAVIGRCTKLHGGAKAPIINKGNRNDCLSSPQTEEKGREQVKKDV